MHNTPRLLADISWKQYSFYNPAQWTWCECKDWQRKCPPCPTAPPPRTDRVPPSRPHYPCPVRRLYLRFAMRHQIAFVGIALLILTIGCNGFVGEARITTSDAKTAQKPADQKRATDQSKATSSGNAGRSERR